jgi:hypothetical protein
VAACRRRSQCALAIAQKRIAPILSALADGEQQLNQARADEDARHAALLATT